MSELKLVTVYESMGILTAEVIKGKLESAGIPVLLKYESLGQVMGLTVDGLGLVRVQVPEEYADDAAALVAEAPASEELADLIAEELEPEGPTE